MTLTRADVRSHASKERLPHRVLEGGRDQDQCPLAVALRRLGDQLAGQEGLAEAHLVREECATPGVDDPPDPRHAVALESRQSQDRVIFGILVPGNP